MYKLKDGQFITVRQYGDSYYSCVCDKNQGLISYSGFSYIRVINGELKINSDKFNNDLKSMVEYDIAKEINCVTNPTAYGDFVRTLKGHQMTLFQMNSFKTFLEEIDCVGNDLYNMVSQNCNYVDKLVEFNEKVFVEQIAPSVPKNWPYAMFPESSWTAYESNVNLCKFAQGDVSTDADKFGISMKDIKGFTNGVTESTVKFNALNEEIMADIENGYYDNVDENVISTEDPNSGNI